MKIICCGSSFSSIDPSLPGTHYSELIADSLDAELINIAKPGSSNFAIRLQIDTAIKLKPDLIMFEFASASRLDLPLSVLGESGKYNKDNLAHNLRYTNYHSVVDPVINTEQESVISDSITNLIDANCFVRNERLTPSARSALKYWFSELYNENIKYHQDYYLVTSVFWPLHQSKIPYIWTRGDLCMFDWSMYPYEVSDAGNPWLCTNMVNTTYHTTPEVQQKIFEHWMHCYRQYHSNSI